MAQASKQANTDRSQKHAALGKVLSKEPESELLASAQKLGAALSPFTLISTSPFWGILIGTFSTCTTSGPPNAR